MQSNPIFPCVAAEGLMEQVKGQRIGIQAPKRGAFSHTALPPPCPQASAVTASDQEKRGGAGAGAGAEIITEALGPHVSHALLHGGLGTLHHQGRFLEEAEHSLEVFKK